MSTVLWANVLSAGKVMSAQADNLALYKHAEKLDSITNGLGLTPFLSICDTTDARFNADEVELAEVMESTNELMAVQGAWTTISDAITMLEALLQHIVENKTRFGLLTNQYQSVVDELTEVLSCAGGQMSTAEKFNFSVVT